MKSFRGIAEKVKFVVLSGFRYCLLLKIEIVVANILFLLILFQC